MNRLKLIAAFLFLASGAFAFTAPGSAGAWSIRTDYIFPSNPPAEPSSPYIQDAVMPKPRFYPGSPVENYPWPTNRWFGHTYILSEGWDVSNPNNPIYWHFPYSMQMSASPMVIAFHTSMWGFAGNPPEKCEGYLLGAPYITYILPNAAGIGDGLQVGQSQNSYALLVAGIYGGGSTIAVSQSVGTMLKDYSDWAATVVVQDQTDPSKTITTTFGKGLLFTYNTFSAGVNPRIKSMGPTGPNTTLALYPYDSNGNSISAGGSFTGDRAMIKYISSTGITEYFGIYAPPGTIFKLTNTTQLDITFADAGAANYMSISLLKYDAVDNFAEAKRIFDDYYLYAYNFVAEIAGTKAEYAVNTSQSNVTTDFKFAFTPQRTGLSSTGANFYTDQTVFAVFPHQWKYMPASFEPQTYRTLRGTMKVVKGNSFSVTYNFSGILPYLTNEIPSQYAGKMSGYMATDSAITVDNVLNTYRKGKQISKAANLIPIFHQSGNAAYRDNMLGRLKDELVRWFTYTGAGDDKYFSYDSAWGGLIGYPWNYTFVGPGYVAANEGFGTHVYNDHHFTYGYYVYASAIYSMFDPDFAAAGQYKGIVDAIAKDYANFVRGDSIFPYMRTFDVYEGHSWAQGRGGADDRGNDQESSAEAMNSWAAIYLWGIATGNQYFINEGIYGYATEAAAIREYYFDADKTTYAGTPWNRAAAGILFDNFVGYSLWWTPQVAQTIMVMQVYPLTPSMLYLGYDPAHTKSVYAAMLNNKDNSAANVNLFKDIWLKFKALYDGSGALADWNAAANPQSFVDDGNSLSATFQFISFFNAYGQVNTDYYTSADTPFGIMKKTSGANPYTFVVYNNDASGIKTVKFNARPGKSAPPESAIAFVPAKTILTTSDFIDFKFQPMDKNTRIFSHTSANKWSVFTVGSTMTFNTANPSITFNERNLPIYNSTYVYVGGSAFDLLKTADTNVSTGVPMIVRYSISSLGFSNFVADESLLRLAVVDADGNVAIVSGAPDTAAHAFQINIINSNFGKTYVLVYPLNAPRDIKVYAYPNPYMPSRHGSTGIRFTNLYAGAQISVFNVAGEKVFETVVTANGEYNWNVANNAGSPIASGVYIYYIESNGKVVKGKLVIER